MKSRKNFAKTISIATTLITLAFFAFGCGDAKTTADTPKETEKATEIVSQEETEKLEPATEVVAEEETEQEVETEEEESVLFRISVSCQNGAYISEKPSDFAYGELTLVDFGTEFNVYEVYENSEEDSTYYRVKSEEGEDRYIWDGDVQVIE